MDAREIDTDVAGCAAAHQRLLAHLDAIAAATPDDDIVAQPSQLPSWTVGHVLTHLARNAESFTHMIDAAGRGEVADQYPGGREQRDADIEAGATRLLAEQIADVRRTIWDLEAAWSRATREAWQGTGRSLVGEVPIAHLPHRRWREVEIHHVDLGLGQTFADWSPDFVRRELARQTNLWKSRRSMGMTDLPSEVLALDPAHRLAWFVGRMSLAGVPDAGLMA